MDINRIGNSGERRKIINDRMVDEKIWRIDKKINRKENRYNWRWSRRGVDWDFNGSKIFE